MCGNCNKFLSLLVQLNVDFLPPFSDISGKGEGKGGWGKGGMVQLLICPFGCDNGSVCIYFI